MPKDEKKDIHTAALGLAFYLAAGTPVTMYDIAVQMESRATMAELYALLLREKKQIESLAEKFEQIQD
jgi:hypothetical protein